MAEKSNIVPITDEVNASTVALPGVYTKAVQFIRDTVTLDEAKHWIDKSEALNAWAQMYHDDQVGDASKRLRLHAYRRMGQLAQELQPTKTIKGGGRTKGPNALLRKAGLSRHGSNAAIKLAKATDDEAHELVTAERPISPTTYERQSYDRSGLAAFRNHQRTPFSCRIFIREVTPRQATNKLGALERREAATQLKDLQKWIDEFIRLCQ